MGGKKKRSLKQIRKAQKERPSKKEKRPAPAKSESKAIPGITQPNVKTDKVVRELRKMKILTPYTVASHFDLRLSVARNFLRELERTGMIEFVSKSRNLKIYKPRAQLD